MTKLFADSGDPDQTPHSAVSDLGLHCLPMTILLVSQLQWVKCIYEKVNKPHHGNRAFIAYVNREGSGQPAHQHSLARTNAVYSLKQ